MNEQEIEEKIQKIIHYMIPQKWKNVKIFALAKNNMNNKKGELYFYYLPNDIFSKEYINCYEIPSLYNIDENEFNNLITKLYNYILILRDYHSKIYNNYWNLITITIDKGIMKLETDSTSLNDIPFSSYELQVIWRYVNLKIDPMTREEKEIISRYLKSNFSKAQKANRITKALKIKSKNILEYDKVLTIDEILARKTAKLEESYLDNQEDKLKNLLDTGIKIVNNIVNNNKYKNEYDELFK